MEKSMVEGFEDKVSELFIKFLRLIRSRMEGFSPEWNINFFVAYLLKKSNEKKFDRLCRPRVKVAKAMDILLNLETTLSRLTDTDEKDITAKCIELYLTLSQYLEYLCDLLPRFLDDAMKMLQMVYDHLEDAARSDPRIEDAAILWNLSEQSTGEGTSTSAIAFSIETLLQNVNEFERNFIDGVGSSDKDSDSEHNSFASSFSQLLPRSHHQSSSSSSSTLTREGTISSEENESSLYGTPRESPLKLNPSLNKTRPSVSSSNKFKCRKQSLNKTITSLRDTPSDVYKKRELRVVVSPLPLDSINNPSFGDTSSSDRCMTLTNTDLLNGPSNSSQSPNTDSLNQPSTSRKLPNTLFLNQASTYRRLPKTVSLNRSSNSKQLPNTLSLNRSSTSRLPPKDNSLNQPSTSRHTNTIFLNEPSTSRQLPSLPKKKRQLYTDPENLFMSTPTTSPFRLSTSTRPELPLSGSPQTNKLKDSDLVDLTLNSSSDEEDTDDISEDHTVRSQNKPQKPTKKSNDNYSISDSDSERSCRWVRTNQYGRRWWNHLEEEQLLMGISRYGTGNWKCIIDRYHMDRKPQQLFDKYRNLLKNQTAKLKIENRIRRKNNEKLQKQQREEKERHQD